MVMNPIEVDPQTTDIERAAWETAHRFAKDVMRPAGIALDKLSAEAAISSESVLWDVIKKYRELGLNLASEDPDLSPLERARLRCLVLEEMGWGDAGLACGLATSDFPTLFARMSGNPVLMERFPVGTLGCWAMTEPDHGSDMVNLGGHLNHPGAKPGRPNCIARRHGDEFVISGQKSAWISNATIADAVVLFCAVDMGDGRSGYGAFIVSLNSDGVSRGKPTEKLGQRPLNQGEIFFNDLRVPADSLVIPPEHYEDAVENVLALANASMGAVFAGCARAAFELALDYAKTRVQGGVPIIQHQSVKSRLFKMFQKVEAARALNRHVVTVNLSRERPLVHLSMTSKVTSTQAAFEVASEAMQIFGGAGITHEYPIEKIFRDARLSMIEDGCNEVLGMLAASRF